MSPALVEHFELSVLREVSIWIFCVPIDKRERDIEVVLLPRQDILLSKEVLLFSDQDVRLAVILHDPIFVNRERYYWQ